LKLPEDIVEYVSRNFTDTEMPVVIATLESGKLPDGNDPDFRMLRCVLVASKNSVAEVERLVAYLALDYRDVIVAGEYATQEGELVRIRDLSLPFANTALS
jgi:hypothetical protein